MQVRVRSKKQEKKRRILAFCILLFCVCSAFATELLQADVGETTDGFEEVAGLKVRESLYKNVVDYFLPVTGYRKQPQRSVSQIILDMVLECFPVYTYAAQGETPGMSESDLEAQLEQELAAQLQQENEAWAGGGTGPEESGAGQQDGDFRAEDVMQQSFLYQMQGESAGSREKTLFSYATEKSAQVDLEELSDYKTLVKKHYVIDGTTGSNKSQLNVKRLIRQDMTLGESDGPQILIYHTHSLEGYRDSRAGSLSESVVGLGDYLTEILTGRYGLKVLHDRSTYDTERDRAYGVAGPALEKILRENPSIEVVIDLHRDGVAEDTYLLTEVNDTLMAPVMFFNGLSYTNKNGKLASLKNPNLQTNLAFSLQMELLASEYYPGLSRGIYLKGLRYNLHYCPKSLLVEVGAQTNTLQEAMNAMPPLADILNRVLSGEKP